MTVSRQVHSMISHFIANADLVTEMRAIKDDYQMA